MPEVQSVTSLQSSPEEERKRRMRGYLIAMTVRVICIIMGVVVTGPLMWLCFAGAIFLPYFAVIFANAVGDSERTKAQRVVHQAPVLEAPPVKVQATEFKIVPKDGDA